MRMSAIALVAGVAVSGLGLGAAAEARAAPVAVHAVRYDPYYGGGYDRYDRHDRRWDRQQRRWHRQFRRGVPRGYYGYGYGYGYAPRCWVEYRYGRRVRICG